jgi:hypothetical protein
LPAARKSSAAIIVNILTKSLLYSHHGLELHPLAVTPKPAGTMRELPDVNNFSSYVKTNICLIQRNVNDVEWISVVEVKRDANNFGM